MTEAELVSVFHSHLKITDALVEDLKGKYKIFMFNSKWHRRIVLTGIKTWAIIY